MRLVLEVRFDEDYYYVQAITKWRASLLVKSFIRLDIGHESTGVNRRPHQCFVKLNLMVSAGCEPTSGSHAFGVLVNSLWSFPVLNTLVKVNADVNTDGHQGSKTSGRAHAPNGPDPLRQLFACPWNSSSGGPATVSDVEPDRLP